MIRRLCQIFSAFTANNDTASVYVSRENALQMRFGRGCTHCTVALARGVSDLPRFEQPCIRGASVPLLEGVAQGARHLCARRVPLAVSSEDVRPGSEAVS